MKARTHPGHYVVVFEDDIEKYGLGAANVLGLIRLRCNLPGGVCWEGVRGMAKRLRMGKDTVSKIIGQLEDAGEITLSPSKTKRWSGSRDIRLAHPVTIDEALEDIEIRNLSLSRDRSCPNPGTGSVLIQGQESKQENNTETNRVVVPQKYLKYARDMGARDPEKYALKCFQGGVLDKGKTPTDDVEAHRASARASRASGLFD